MNELLKNIRNNIIFVSTKALANKIDGREITKKLDEMMDEHLGKRSEPIQRGPFSDFLFQMIEGLWEEDMEELRDRVRVWLNEVAHEAKQQKGE